VEPAVLCRSLGEAVVAVVTDGGLITAGNPEGLPAGFHDRYVRISVAGLDTLDARAFSINYGGFDTRFLVEDPNRLVPLDALRALERERTIGAVFGTVHSTAGLGMSVSNARRIGREIAASLKRDGVDVAILTST
jgi:glycine reductase